MKVGFLAAVVLGATVALYLSDRANTQEQKREARAVPEATPTPSLVSATPANKTAPLSGVDPEWWS